MRCNVMCCEGPLKRVAVYAPNCHTALVSKNWYLPEFALWCNNYQKGFVSRSWGLKDSMAYQLHFTRHRNTRSPQGYWVQHINKTGIRRVRAGLGAAHGEPAQTPSPTRIKTHVSANPDSDQFQCRPLRISTKLNDSDLLHLF